VVVGTYWGVPQRSERFLTCKAHQLWLVPHVVPIGPLRPNGLGLSWME
jgi:hypothetical protein